VYHIESEIDKDYAGELIYLAYLHMPVRHRNQPVVALSYETCY